MSAKNPHEPPPRRRNIEKALREWYEGEVAYVAAGHLYSDHIHPIDLLRRTSSKATWHNKSKAAWLSSGLTAYRLVCQWAVADGLPVQPQLNIDLPTPERINPKKRPPSRKQVERLLESRRYHSPPSLIVRSWRACAKPGRSKALIEELGWHFPEVGDREAHESIYLQAEYRGKTPGPFHYFLRAIQITYVTTDLDIRVRPDEAIV